MKHWIAALLALPLASAAHAADCSFAKAEDVLTQPRPEEPNQQIDVLVQQSVEGGSWTVFNGPDGKPNRIIRTDYGEGGRTEYALAVQKPTPSSSAKPISAIPCPIMFQAAP